MTKRIRRIAHCFDSKALFQEQFRNPLTDEEFVLDEQNPDRLTICCVHGTHPPVP
jgi:hypothetical protein